MQEPAPQMADPLTGFAMSIGIAFGNVALMVLSIVIAAPALASMTLLWAGQRWPSFGTSLIANCLAGAGLTIAIGWLIAIALGLLSGVVDLNGIYGAMPLVALALMALMLVLQWPARASFLRARLAGVMCAILTLVAWVAVYNLRAGGLALGGAVRHKPPFERRGR